jgi:F-type H+-transporting ATPase subunit delta
MSDKKKINEVVKDMEDFLIVGGNIQDLKAVVKEFDELLEKEEKFNTALVTSAYKLTESQQKGIESTLNNLYQQNLDFEYLIDTKVVAGIKIQVFDEIIDMTIDNALENIKESLKN